MKDNLVKLVEEEGYIFHWDFASAINKLYYRKEGSAPVMGIANRIMDNMPF